MKITKKTLAMLALGFLSTSVWAVPMEVISRDASGQTQKIALENIQRIDIIHGENPSLSLQIKVYGETIEKSGIQSLRFFEEGTAVDEIQSTDQGYLLYPNPVESVLNIDGTVEGQLINVYSLSGELVLQAASQESLTTVDVASLSVGNYLLRIGSTTLKFIKK